MAEINAIITFLVASRPGITDRQLSDAIYGEEFPTGFVSGRCRELESTGKIRRRRSFTNVTFEMGNYPHPDLRVNRDQNFHNLLISVHE